MANEEYLTFLDGDATRDSGLSGLSALFDMTNGFLGIVQPKTIADLVSEFNIEKWSDFDSEFLTDDWNEWIIYFIGYLICAGIGVLLIIIMPFVGCGFCCCRCCGLCGATKKKGATPEKDQGSRICCSVFTILLSGTMLIIAICTIFTSSIIYNEFQEGRTNLY